jgi:hypothetical protein
VTFCEVLNDTHDRTSYNEHNAVRDNYIHLDYNCNVVHTLNGFRLSFASLNSLQAKNLQLDNHSEVCYASKRTTVSSVDTIVNKVNRSLVRSQVCSQSQQRSVMSGYPNRDRNGNYWRNYRLTTEQVEKMFAKQSGLCLICQKPMTLIAGRKPKGTKYATVDHVHGTRKVRGLLCNHCNSMIGMAMDDIDILISAVVYLRSTTQTQKGDET